MTNIVTSERLEHGRATQPSGVTNNGSHCSKTASSCSNTSTSSNASMMDPQEESIDEVSKEDHSNIASEEVNEVMGGGGGMVIVPGSQMSTVTTLGTSNNYEIWGQSSLEVSIDAGTTTSLSAREMPGSDYILNEQQGTAKAVPPSLVAVPVRTEFTQTNPTDMETTVQKDQASSNVDSNNVSTQISTIYNLSNQQKPLQQQQQEQRLSISTNATKSVNISNHQGSLPQTTSQHLVYSNNYASTTIPSGLKTNTQQQQFVPGVPIKQAPPPPPPGGGENFTESTKKGRFSICKQQVQSHQQTIQQHAPQQQHHHQPTPINQNSTTLPATSNNHSSSNHNSNNQHPTSTVPAQTQVPLSSPSLVTSKTISSSATAKQYSSTAPASTTSINEPSTPKTANNHVPPTRVTSSSSVLVAPTTSSQQSMPLVPNNLNPIKQHPTTTTAGTKSAPPPIINQPSVSISSNNSVVPVKKGRFIVSSADSAATVHHHSKNPSSITDPTATVTAPAPGAHPARSLSLNESTFPMVNDSEGVASVTSSNTAVAAATTTATTTTVMSTGRKVGKHVTIQQPPQMMTVTKHVVNVNGGHSTNNGTNGMESTNNTSKEEIQVSAVNGGVTIFHPHTQMNQSDGSSYHTSTTTSTAMKIPSKVLQANTTAKSTSTTTTNTTTSVCNATLSHTAIDGSSSSISSSSVPVTAALSTQSSKSTGILGNTQCGVGKLFHFLEQMRLEVIEADKTIKSLQSDNKYLRGKNKELESRCNDADKRYSDEKIARENAEAKIRSLKKKLKEVKELTSSVTCNGTTNGDHDPKHKHHHPDSTQARALSLSSSSIIPTITDYIGGGLGTSKSDSAIHDPTSTTATTCNSLDNQQQSQQHFHQEPQKEEEGNFSQKALSVASLELLNSVTDHHSSYTNYQSSSSSSGGGSGDKKVLSDLKATNTSNSDPATQQTNDKANTITYGTSFTPTKANTKNSCEKSQLRDSLDSFDPYKRKIDDDAG